MDKIIAFCKKASVKTVALTVTVVAVAVLLIGGVTTEEIGNVVVAVLAVLSAIVGLIGLIASLIKK